MRTRTKAAILAVAILGIAGAGAARYAAVDEREIGRTDPRRAAKYRPPWFNFAETYADGAVLGVAVGSTREEAIAAAERAGLIVEPSEWGDNRAGGASLYERSDLLTHMLRQPDLAFYDPRDLKRGIIVYFRDGRVSTIDVHYINFENI